MLINVLCIIGDTMTETIKENKTPINDNTNFNNLYTTERIEATMPLKKFVENYFDGEIVEHIFCPKCFNYGKIWMCPPHADDSLTVWKEYINKYENLTFVITKIKFSQELRSKTYTTEDILTKIIPNTINKENYKLIDELRIREQETGGEYINAGPCILCPAGCSRPLGQPCRQPNRARRGWDELGTYVTKAVEQETGTKLHWFDLQEGTVPEYTCVIAGLMFNEN